MADYGAEQHINVHVPADSRGEWANSRRSLIVRTSSLWISCAWSMRTRPDRAAGVLVARVNLSPLLVTQLIDALQENWERYASKAGRETWGRDA